MTPERNDEIAAFLAASGWSGAKRLPLPGDASTRRYERLSLNGRNAMLMDQPQQAEAPPAPPDATPEERRTLGYNALARLAGGDVERFIAVSKFLRSAGLSAPDVFAADSRLGLAVIEDLGDDLFTTVLARSADERELYAASAEVLAALHERTAPAVMPLGKSLHAFDETAQFAEIDLMTDWFIPLALGRKATSDVVEEHHALWRRALDRTRHAAPVFVHRDFHAQNLIWLPGRTGVQRVGLIDYQDAVAGSTAYDLISLVEDARRDASAGTAEATTTHYLAAMRAQGMPRDESEFRAQMAVSAAQRNVKIAGIFARLYARDGKARYLGYLPRVWGYINRDLQHPALAELREWYDRTIPPEKRDAPKGVTA